MLRYYFLATAAILALTTQTFAAVQAATMGMAVGSPDARS